MVAINHERYGGMSQKSESNEPMANMSALVQDAEVRESSRAGTKKPDARAALANRLGVSKWTLTNFLRGRLKDLRGATRDKIRAGIIRELEGEIGRLTHDLEMARQIGACLSDDEIFEVAAALEKARTLMKKKDGE
jgi:hypothetical protein